MILSDQRFETRLARQDAELLAAQRLRYAVFVEELGGNGPLVDHENRLERDHFDPLYDHLLLIDTQRAQDADMGVVGVYRLLRGETLSPTDVFYSESEYDLTVLKTSGRRLLELGRSCLHKDYRGGSAMLHLWSGLADYVSQYEIEVLFGVASFHGTNIGALKQPLSLLHQRHLAPESLRVRAVAAHYQPMDLLPADQINRRAAMLATPALIKAYLRLGGFVGDGAFVDHSFNTTDVCLVMDTEQMNARQKSIYSREPQA